MLSWDAETAVLMSFYRRISITCVLSEVVPKQVNMFQFVLWTQKVLWTYFSLKFQIKLKIKEKKNLKSKLNSFQSFYTFGKSQRFKLLSLTISDKKSRNHLPLNFKIGFARSFRQLVRKPLARLNLKTKAID